MRALGIVVLVMIVGLSEAQPQNWNGFFSGNDAYSWCQKDRSVALGYAAGLSDEAAHGSFMLETFPLVGSKVQVDALRNTAKDLFGEFCRPNDVVLDQVTDVFRGYLRDVPGDRPKPAVLLFHAAMKKAWPCTKR
jgi:hypothetical protein